MNSRTFAGCALAILAIATTARTVWLHSDPPVVDPVGIVWHDEGAWTHNARNKALFGVWRTDDWNPVFVAPVFTALEYGAFTVFGVGLWQARVVPVVSGLAIVAFMMVGLLRLAGRRSSVIGGALLATSYALVMWNRAALLESTMIAFIAASWTAAVLAERRPRWGLATGAFAAMAWFTKASAVFFIAAVVVDALVRLVTSRQKAGTGPSADAVCSATWTLIGLGGTAVLVGAAFVLPHWNEYGFYNWQMSVLRKPVFSIAAFADRASWIPFVQSTLSRIWPVLVLGNVALFVHASQLLSLRSGERLLVLWVLIGLAELVVHDSGNERRYVMFIPATVALAALLAADVPRVLPRGLASAGLPIKLAMAATAASGVYIVAGSALRAVFLDEIYAGSFRVPVRISAAAAVLSAGVLPWMWRPFTNRLAMRAVPRSFVALAAAVTVAWNAFLYAEWLRYRGEHNYRASVALGQALPDGTLVQGKLANGLALNNGIRPLFVGNGFGNYADRLDRDDARYLLTYDLPRIGYESSDGSGLIEGILEHYPRHRAVFTLEVDETTAPDRAVLIDKLPDSQ